jgi:hypothetical protein
MDSKQLFKSLVWSHVDPLGKVVESSRDAESAFPEVKLEDAVNVPAKIKKWFEANYTCQVTGSLDVTKVTGQLVFRLRGQSPAL